VEWVLIWSLVLNDLKFGVDKSRIFIVLDLIFYNWVERLIVKLFLGFQLEIKKSYLYLVDHSIVVIFAWSVELE